MEAQTERDLLVARRKPLIITWKKARPADFDVLMGPLVAQGWFKTTESMMSNMRLYDNEKVKCASFHLTIDDKVWWESMELKYNIDEMIWA